jgi:hypothetical protein
MHPDADPGPAAPHAHTGPTFVGLPRACDAAAVDLAVIGIPVDELGPGGAAAAPLAVRAASTHLNPHYNPSQRVEVAPRP